MNETIMADLNPSPDTSGRLNWRLSAHPITLVTFLSFRAGMLQHRSRALLTTNLSPTASLLVYLLGLLFTSNFVLIFIVTILLLAADFYYLKNIAGRRLVGLRWWNEVDSASGTATGCLKVRRNPTSQVGG